MVVNIVAVNCIISGVVEIGKYPEKHHFQIINNQPDMVRITINHPNFNVGLIIPTVIAKREDDIVRIKSKR